jgi:hypothetical protein
MTVLCYIEVLEHGFQVDAAGCYGEAVLLENLFKIKFTVILEVLAAS